MHKTKFTLDPANALGSSTEYFGFGFGCACEPKEGKIQLVKTWHTCREGLINSMRTRITAEDGSQPTDKMRMIFRFSAGNNNRPKNLKIIDEWMERTIPVLQALDKLAGWPLTRVYRIETNHDNWLRAYYTHSSRRWMKSSYLVSLYCMLVRMCKDDRIKGFKDFAGLVNVIHECLNSGTAIKSDHTYVKSSVPYWEALMRGYPRLFQARKMDYYWDTSRISGSSGSAEGIQYLVKGDTSYTEVRTELLKIKKEIEAGTFSPEVKNKKKK